MRRNRNTDRNTKTKNSNIVTSKNAKQSTSTKKQTLPDKDNITSNSSDCMPSTTPHKRRKRFKLKLNTNTKTKTETEVTKEPIQSRLSILRYIKYCTNIWTKLKLKIQNVLNVKINFGFMHNQIMHPLRPRNIHLNPVKFQICPRYQIGIGIGSYNTTHDKTPTFSRKRKMPDSFDNHSEQGRESSSEIEILTINQSNHNLHQERNGEKAIPIPPIKPLGLSIKCLQHTLIQNLMLIHKVMMRKIGYSDLMT